MFIASIKKNYGAKIQYSCIIAPFSVCGLYEMPLSLYGGQARGTAVVVSLCAASVAACRSQRRAYMLS